MALAYGCAIAVMVASINSSEVPVIATAVVFDLVIVFPLAAYLFVVRPMKWPVASALPFVVLGMVVASVIVPTQHQSTLSMLKNLAAPVEIGLVAWLIWRVKKAASTAKGSAIHDPMERIGSFARALVGSNRAAEILKTEVAVFHYALSLRPGSHAPESHTPVAYHERSGHLGMVMAAMTILSLEGIFVHVMVAKWSVLIAWLLSLGTLYVGVWLVADYRAAVRRPILVGAGAIVFRAGLRWHIEVKREDIALVSRTRPEEPAKIINMTFLSEPSLWITFKEPIVAHGAYGTRKSVSIVGIEPDSSMSGLLT